jgi:type I restriction enzyme S subunit
MSIDLPRVWTTAKLAELFDFKYGKSLPQEKRNGKGAVNVYGSNGIVGVHTHAVSKGPTIIVGRKGSVGEIHLSTEKCWPIDTAYYIDEFPGGLPPKYWALYLKSLRLGQQEKSSAIPGISRSHTRPI